MHCLSTSAQIAFNHLQPGYTLVFNSYLTILEVQTKLVVNSSWTASIELLAASQTALISLSKRSRNAQRTVSQYTQSMSVLAKWRQDIFVHITVNLRPILWCKNTFCIPLFLSRFTTFFSKTEQYCNMKFPRWLCIKDICCVQVCE